ncbi:hypothetical protein D3C87_1353890 [compost metagenome]
MRPHNILIWLASESVPTRTFPSAQVNMVRIWLPKKLPALGMLTMFLWVARPVTARVLTTLGIRPSSLIRLNSPSIVERLCLHCTRFATNFPTLPSIPSKGSSLESLGDVLSPASLVFHSNGSHPRFNRKSFVSALEFRSVVRKLMRL